MTMQRKAGMRLKNSRLKNGRLKNNERRYRVVGDRDGLRLEGLEARRLLAGDLLLSGVIDGPLTGGTPKAIELYAAQDIDDLSVYGVGSANNGGGSDGVEFRLSGSATAGQFLYVASESLNFQEFFGFAPDFESAVAGVNGDDAIELFWDANADGFSAPLGSDDVVIDVFGEVDADGTGTAWDYQDGWAYRKSNTKPNNSSFVLADWDFSGPNALDGEAANGTAVAAFPVGSYSVANGPNIAVKEQLAASFIAAGATPTAGQGTDFGIVVLDSAPISKTFEIFNRGTAALVFSETPPVAIDGSENFTISLQPEATIAVGESQAFEVTFSPAVAGEQAATVSIAHNDADATPFVFTVEASVSSSLPTERNVVINEVDTDTEGDEDQEFIELYDGGAGNTPLDGLVLVLFNGNGSVAYEAFDLDGYSTNAEGFFVLGDALTPHVNMVPDNFTISSNIQNGEDAVALYVGETSDFVDGTLATTTNLIDAVVYETGSDADSSLPADLGVVVVHDENANGLATTQSLSRDPDGMGSFVATSPTPGNSNMAVAGQPEINLTGLAQAIVSGDSTPSAADDTDYGSVALDAVAVERTFTITNTGDSDLELGELTLTGSADFMLAQPASSIVAPGENESFTVRFAPTSVDTHVATISIPSNDVDENPYTFQVQGSGITVATNLVINEVDTDMEGDEDREFIELYDGGEGNTPLDGLVLVFFNGANSTAYAAFDLDGMSTDDGGFFVLGDTLTPGVDFTPENFTISSNIQNGEDAIALYLGDAVDFPSGTAVTTVNLLDALVYETGNDADSTLSEELGLTEIVADENGNGRAGAESISRFPDGTGPFVVTTPSPGEANAAVAMEPEVEITGNEQSIAAGAAEPSENNGTDFGSVAVGWASLQRTFVIQNVGNGDLILNAIALDGDDGFSLEPPTSLSLAPGSSESFAVTFSPQMPGEHGATIFIQSSDTDTPSFQFMIRGTGITVATHVVINEVDSDNEGEEDQEFVELYDGGDGNTSLTGLTLVLFNGASGGAYEAFDLDGFSTDENGFFVLGDALTPNVDYVPSDFTASSDLQNGEDAVALYVSDATYFPNGTMPTTVNLLDALVYETDSDADTTLSQDLATDAVFDENQNGLSGTQSISRLAGGAAEFSARVATPGGPNAEQPEPELDILGNGEPIFNGDTATSLTNGTDFGSVETAEGTSLRTFLLVNSGTETLSVDWISVDGTNPDDFGVGDVPAAVAAGESIPVQITFAPTADGLRTATITVVNNDADEGEYRFTVKGTGESTVVLIDAVEVDIELTSINGQHELHEDLAVADELVYSIYVHNMGTSSLTGIAIETPTPRTATFVAPLDFDGTLTPQQAVTYSVSLVVTQAHIDAGSIALSATVEADGEHGRISSSTDVANNIARTSAVAMTISANGVDAESGLSITEGEAIQWRFTVTNTGNVSLTNVSLASQPELTGFHAQMSADNNDGVLSPGEAWDFDADEFTAVEDLELLLKVLADTLLGGELQHEQRLHLSVTPWVPALPDFDRNGRVEFADFLILSANFGLSEKRFDEGDADGDGTINFADFLTLSQFFGQSTQAADAALAELSSVELSPSVPKWN